MDNERFEKIVATETAMIQDVLTSKADEYARGDRLSNFKKMGALLGITPEKALITLVTKHYAALTDFINDLDDGLEQPYDRWNEKIGDIECYMVLLKALVIERTDIGEPKCTSHS